MTFKDELLNEAVADFLDPNEFAESVTYLPSAGGSKVINALVVRERRDTDEQSRGRLITNEAEVYIANSVTSGVASVDYQGQDADKIQFPVQEDDAPVTWRVVAVIHKDKGMWHLRVKR